MRLEDLVQFPERTMSEMQQFIGLCSAGMVEFPDAKRAHIGRYKSDLSAEDLAFMTKGLEEALVHYGYA